jgi:hypothetical protein
MPLFCLLGVKSKSWVQRARSCCDVPHNLRHQRPCFWPWSPYFTVRMMALHVWMFNWLLKFPVPWAHKMIFLNYIGILLLRWDFLVIILLTNKGHLGTFFLVPIWMKSFMELLLGWILHTQHLLSDPWIGTGQMNISGTGLKDNLCLPMKRIGSQLQDGSQPYWLHLLE